MTRLSSLSRFWARRSNRYSINSVRLYRLYPRPIQQVPVVVRDDAPFEEDQDSQKVVKQSSILWLLKQNASKLSVTIKQSVVDDLRYVNPAPLFPMPYAVFYRYLTGKAVTCLQTDRVVDILRKLVEKNAALIAVEDENGTLTTTFSVSTLKVQRTSPLLNRCLYTDSISTGTIAMRSIFPCWHSMMQPRWVFPQPMNDNIVLTWVSDAKSSAHLCESFHTH